MCSPSATPPAIEPVVQTLVLHNKLDDLTHLAVWVNNQADYLGLSQEATFRLDLVLAEAVTNIIQYAFTDDRLPHLITITLRWSGQTLTAEIEDDGRPFNPLHQPQVTLPTSLDQAGQGGLGIHLIRNCADAVDYCRRQRKNVLTVRIDDANV